MDFFEKHPLSDSITCVFLKRCLIVILLALCCFTGYFYPQGFSDLESTIEVKIHCRFQSHTGVCKVIVLPLSHKHLAKLC